MVVGAALHIVVVVGRLRNVLVVELGVTSELGRRGRNWRSHRIQRQMGR